jgi:hypothetical protein
VTEHGNAKEKPINIVLPGISWQVRFETTDTMRGVLAYLVGASAAVSIGLLSLKALPATIERTVPAPLAALLHIRMPYGLKLWSAIANASHKGHVTEPRKQIVGQKVQ